MARLICARVFIVPLGFLSADMLGAGSRFLCRLAILSGIFGFFLILSAVLLWRKTRVVPNAGRMTQFKAPTVSDGLLVLQGLRPFCGVAAGMVGIGGEYSWSHCLACCLVSASTVRKARVWSR